MHGHTTPTSSAGFMYPQASMGASSSVSEINSIVMSHSPQAHQIYGARPQQNQLLGASSNNTFQNYTPPYMISASSTKSALSKVGKIDQLKTPVSLLNEVCAKAKIIPQFETAEAGPPHDRVFECIVKLERQGMTWEGKGVAKAKKDARQEAAKSLLVSMDEQVEKLLIPSKTDEVDQQQNLTNMIDCDPDVEGNPVGELNDLCLKIKRQPPEYEDIDTEGKPHESVHIVACKLGTQYIEQGRGRTKKHAKKVAAHKVKQHLTELMLAGGGSQTDGDDETNDGCIIEKIQALALGSNNNNKQKSKNKTKDNIKEDTFKLGEWLAGFRERTGEKLMSLQDPNNKASGGTTDSTKLLKDIAEEQKFKIEYLDIEKNPGAGGGDSQEESLLFASIVSIGIEPIAIFLGTGGSKTQARKSAALKAVEFLKIAVKK